MAHWETEIDFKGRDKKRFAPPAAQGEGGDLHQTLSRCTSGSGNRSSEVSGGGQVEQHFTTRRPSVGESAKRHRQTLCSPSSPVTPGCMSRDVPRGALLRHPDGILIKSCPFLQWVVLPDSGSGDEERLRISVDREEQFPFLVQPSGRGSVGGW